MAPEASLTPPLTAVEKALRDSLLVPTFRDVHLYAFSRRTILPDGTLRIDHPLPVVTISSILKNTECFSKLLAAPGAVQQYASDSSEYDYESDSDLDEFEELQAEDVDVCPAGAGPSSADKLKVRGSTDRENDEDAVNTSPAAAMKNYIEVSVPNIAYRTLRACVFYLYTGKINFLPLTSSGAVERQLVMFTTSNDLAPPCSSKSVYRLAELYGLTELQELAYNKIISQLGQENILEEMFSSFFVRYDRLREYAVSYLSQNYYKPAVQQSLPDIIQRMALGEMPHASGVLRSLLGLPVAISSPTTGRLVSHSRVIKPSHLRISEPTPPSPCAIDRQSIFKPHVPSQPVVRGTSLNIASNPVPPTKPSSSTASAYTPSSSSIGPGAAVRDLVHEKAPSATSEAGPAETTVAGPGVAGDVGEPTEAQAPDNVPVVQLIAPGVGPSDDSAPVDETSIERSSKTTKKKRLKKKRISDREGTPTRQITSATPASPVPLEAPRLLSSHLCIWPPGYGPDRGPGDADEDAVVNTTPSEPVRTFLP